MPTMPNGFVPTVAAYSHDAPMGVMRTDVAGGFGRYSLDFDRGTQRFNVTLMLDAAQFSIWTIFFLRIIKKGAVTFDMRLDTGLGTALHPVHIVPGSYSATRTAGIVTIVSFVVETTSAVYALSDAQVAAYGLSAATIPAGFVPKVAAYSMEAPGGNVRDDVPGGVAAYALEHDRAPQKFSCLLMLTAAQYAVWCVWYHRLIGKGVRTFEMRLDSGFGPEPHACNILPGSYSATRTGGLLMAVSFAVEAESKAYDLSTIDAEDMVALYSEYGGFSSALLARLATFALVDLSA